MSTTCDIVAEERSKAATLRVHKAELANSHDNAYERDLTVCRPIFKLCTFTECCGTAMHVLPAMLSQSEAMPACNSFTL